MSRKYRHGRPAIGVLAGWRFVWTATPLRYLAPIFRGVHLAVHDLGTNLLLGFDMGSWTGRSASRQPAWPLSSAESGFVPIGPWNTDGLIAIDPLHSHVRSRYLQNLRAAGSPLIFMASGERRPPIAADNRGGILEAMPQLVEHQHIASMPGSPEDMEAGRVKKGNEEESRLPKKKRSRDEVQLTSNGSSPYEMSVSLSLFSWARTDLAWYNEDHR